ncbi:MAG: Mbeg1-like protein [Streptococcus salivarius]
MSQHNALLWQVDPEQEFIYVDQPTEMSQRMEGTFQEWIETFQIKNSSKSEIYSLIPFLILELRV